MQLEFHQLERRWEHLRVRHPARQRRLLASLADSGQQTPIVVVAAEGQADRYVVIDGYKRMAALEQLGRDTVEAVVWPMSEAAAVLLDRSLRLSEHETASTAGFALPGASPDSLFHVIDSSRFRRPLREQRAMDVLGRKPSRAPHDDLIAVLVPFQDRTRANAKLLANASRH